MTKQVHKFPLPEPGKWNSFNAAIGKVVHVDYQNGSPMVWFEVQTDHLTAVAKPFDIHCFGTGWDIPDHLEHLGTLIDESGFVWHYYKVAL